MKRNGALLCALGLLAAGAPAAGQGARAGTDASWADDPPSLEALVAHARAESELHTIVPAYQGGRAALLRATADLPPAEQSARRQRWYRSWLDELASLDFDALSVEGKVDYILLRNRVEQDMSAGDLPPGNQGPIGAEALALYLRRALVPYSAAELIAIGERELEWLDRAMVDAARRMGLGDDWRAAVEAVKDSAVPPGEKPGLIRDLAYQSEAFLLERNSITVPPLMREIWRMGMRGPQGQLTNPFFTGGLQITISYPTDDMTHGFKLMSMRGNNPHFNRATVQHELIPGHGLQAFMTSRFNTHRSLFSTSFWGEGWALYHEFVLWDQGFPRNPADEIGMLTWRKHRAARIIFSLKYHLGEMTEQQAVDFLVDRVAFERSNAEAEVRRSVQHQDPLYQLAYMIGGLQFYALRKELVDTGRLSEREFHDTILLGGRMPVEAVRLRLTGEGLARDYTTRWRFYGDPLGVPQLAPAAPGSRGAVSGTRDTAIAGRAPSLGVLLGQAAQDGDLRVAVRRYQQDLNVLRQRYDVPLSPVRIARERTFHEGWARQLGSLDVTGLNEAGRAEHAALGDSIAANLASLEEQERQARELAPLLPFARPLQLLQERRRDRLDVDPRGAAQTVEDARKEVLRLTQAVPGARSRGDAGLRSITPEVAARAADYIGTLRGVLENWYTYYYGFDPLFTWWVRMPYQEIGQALDGYVAAIRAEWGQ